MSLYQRLSLSLLIVFIILLLTFHWWTQQREKQTRNESQQYLHLSLAANLARDNPLLQHGVYDHQALKNLFHTLMILGPAFEFYFVDPKGKILTHSIQKSYVKRNVIDVQPLIQLTQNTAPLPIYGDDPQHFDRQKVFSAAPVFNGTQLQGYLYVIVTGERYESIHLQNSSLYENQLSMVVIAAAVIFLFIVMLGIFAYFTRPLRKLNQDIQMLRDNGFNIAEITWHPWVKNSSNEVHQLGVAFEQMAVKINHQIKQLQKNDCYRKELLTDISHDLRTPLASLTGYLETLAINQDAASNEIRGNYLAIARKNAEQIKTLIDQLFELAHLEGKQVSLSLETFNITELLYDVVAKFSIAAELKGITLDVLTANQGMLVQSDIAKLERVLSNLLENAIRHTDREGKVTLQVLDKTLSQCQVVVSDNGTGIKKEEVAYIFDTRYRASNATHDNGMHTGLGLAITKKLLELMQSDIKVASELGKGSVFSFNLRKVKH